ncbi:hypothetical protein K504DRAFT_485019 [Pleomassaria siparia CBS 279.74]|uniref:Rhodopsin domain-containing protein n=1 Tax=Pleomassaria siparia CBS 279.74 TaxID=1314801 RepID=A0A6G1JVZ6_9PLEO|nr:hypothetical protein K504DRAFT_485019 [Pleomassaria siparia CBS 279.74]
MAYAQRGVQALVTSSVFTGLATTVVLLRLYTRFIIIRYNGIEDYFVALAMVEYGMGRHLIDVPDDDLRKSLKAFWASLIVYYLSLGLTKTSILLQYRRIFPTKSFHVASWATIVVVVLYTIWAVSGSIFACYPVSTFWTKEEPTRCINQKAMWFTNAAINIMTDFAIIFLPMPVVQSLNMGKRQKQVLLLIFAIGGFGCIVSILRLHSLVSISNSTDTTYDNPPAATWSSVETNVGIICSCLPCLRPLIARSFPGIFSSHQTRTVSNIPNSYNRRLSTRGTRLSNMDSKGSRGSSEIENRDIQVITEVRVSVENKFLVHVSVGGWP